MKKILFLIILSVISSILTAYLYIESVLWMSICAIINFIVNSLIYSTILEIKEKKGFPYFMYPSAILCMILALYPFFFLSRDFCRFFSADLYEGGIISFIITILTILIIFVASTPLYEDKNKEYYKVKINIVKKVLYNIPLIVFFILAALLYQSKVHKSNVYFIQDIEVSDTIITYYSITKDNHEYLLDTPNGNKILNKKATEHFKEKTYYRIGKLDKVKIVQTDGEWVKVEHSLFPENNGWIKKELLEENGNEPNRLNNSTKSNVPKANNSSTLSIGSTAYISVDCAAAYTKEWFDQMERYVSKGNESAFKQMVYEGKLVYLYSGDRVDILDKGFGWTKIAYKGKTLYVISGTLSKHNNSSGKYINAETGERQNRYGGSQQQKDDLQSIDEYGRNHPEFW